MTVTAVYWPFINSRDIHLLPGLVSPQLDHLLVIADTRGNRWASDPRSGVTVSFTPRFAGAPANHGVRVDTRTGEVSVDDPAWLSTPRLRSFIIEVAVTDPSVATPFSTRVRVHVHERVTRMWLTPSPLTMRQSARNVRLSVLAEFDDHTVGDISNWAPTDEPNARVRTFVHAMGRPDPELVWSSDRLGSITVDPGSGVLTCGVAAGNPATITVRRAGPHSLDPAKMATTTVKPAPPWWDPVVTLDHIQGPGIAAANDPDVRNILFLPDGFEGTDSDPDLDRGVFEAYARSVVGRLSYRNRTRPFDRLVDRLNYFTAWVKSPQAGVSVLNELDPVSTAGTTVDGNALELPLPTRTGAAAWTLNELIYEVGPPTPVHDPVPVGPPPTTVPAAKLAEWQGLYGAHVKDALAKGTYKDWLVRNDRVLLNEPDTAFHTGIGDRPRTDGSGSTNRGIAFHPLRLDLDDFDQFLDTLQRAGGISEPAGWTQGRKDQDLVVFLCRSNLHAGANVGRGTGKYLALALGDDTKHHFEASSSGGFDVHAKPVPLQATLSAWTTAAHELAHSWTLADEYGDDSGAGGRLTITAEAALRLAQKTNAQPRSELVDTNGNLVTKDLKWRWPRLEKAGVLSAPPVAAGGNRFLLVFQAGHIDAPPRPFAIGDVVRLRKRPLITAGKASDRLVVAQPPAGNQLVVDLLPGGTLDPTDFPAGLPNNPGSIAMVPRRAPDHDRANLVLGDDLELVAKVVRDRIDHTNNPLNADRDDTWNRPCRAPPLDHLFLPTEPTNFLRDQTPKPPLHAPWIIGVYESADGYDCAVYRPTGVCLMRLYKFRDEDQAYEFCPVCRYAVLDLLDPSKHGQNEDDCAGRYSE